MKIYKQMTLVMAEIGSVKKDQINSFHKYKFRGIDDFLNHLYPALVKHSVFLVPSCQSKKNEILESPKGNTRYVEIDMNYTFYADDGSNVVIGPIPAEALDNSDKALNKALSAALKYCLIQTFSIPTTDMEDSDKESPEIGKKIQNFAPQITSIKKSYIRPTDSEIEKYTKSLPENVADYCIPFSKLKGVRIGDMHTSEIESFVSNLKNHFHTLHLNEINSAFITISAINKATGKDYF